MGRDMSDAFGYAFSMLKANPAQPPMTELERANPSSQQMRQAYDAIFQQPQPNPYSNPPMTELERANPSPQQMRAAFNVGSPIGKAIRPSMQEDPNMPVGQRHHRNLERQKDIHTPHPNLRGPLRTQRMIPEPPLPPHETMPLRNVGRTVYPMNPQGRSEGPRTLPPNPAQMPPGAGAPSMRELGRAPPAPAPPRPVSQENPFLHAMRPEGTLTDEQIMALADEFRIPIEKAWSHLRNR
tara:strand:- start:8645 stop:9361 length:717 start_codon:yes stop_codon:yes gene_type:complete